MLYNGTILISIVINSEYKILSKPLITNKGFFGNDSFQLFKKNVNNRIFNIFKDCEKKRNVNQNEIKNKINTFTRKFFKKSLDIRPVLEIHIIKT